MTKIPTRDEFGALVDNHDKAARWVQVTVRKRFPVSLHKANEGREQTRTALIAVYDQMSGHIAELEAACQVALFMIDAGAESWMLADMEDRFHAVLANKDAE